MTQNQTDNSMRYAKVCAKADRELIVEPWVNISLERRLKDGEREILHSYDLPRGMLSRWLWVIGWRSARMQCKYPRDHIMTYHHNYDKRTGLETGFGTLLYKLSAAKGHLTKIEKAIPEYIDFQKQNNLFFDPETDEMLLKAYRKLEQKRQNYNALYVQMEEEVERHRKTCGHV